MIGLMFARWLLVALALAGFAAAVALVVRRAKAGKPLAAIILVIVAVPAGALFLARLNLPDVKITGGELRLASSRRSARTIEAPPWSQGADQSFLADVYPSQAAAAEAAVRELAAAWMSSRGDDGRPLQATISGKTSTEVLHRAAEALREVERIEQVKVLANGRQPPPGETDQATADIRIDLTPGPASVKSRDGAVLATIQAGTFQTSQTVKFVEKPWVDNFSAFQASSPRGNQLLLAASDRACTSAHEARQRAIEIAAAQLEDRVRAAIERRDPGFWNRPGGHRGPNWLAGQIQADLLLGQAIRDEFTQGFRRPYGDVWQHWMLVDGWSGKVQPMASRIRRAIRTRWTTWLWRSLSLVGVAGLVVVVYVFLNAATRGYYVWSLRVGATIVVLIVVVLLLLWS